MAATTLPKKKFQALRPTDEKPEAKLYRHEPGRMRITLPGRLSPFMPQMYPAYMVAPMG